LHLELFEQPAGITVFFSVLLNRATGLQAESEEATKELGHERQDRPLSGRGKPGEPDAEIHAAGPPPEGDARDQQQDGGVQEEPEHREVAASPARARVTVTP
jgi:hypothetical protein